MKTGMATAHFQFAKSVSQLYAD